MNITDQNYSCTSNLGAEILMVISSSIIAISVMSIYSMPFRSRIDRINSQKTSLFVSSAYALFLPLMSYEFSQVKQYKIEGRRAQVILIWMVLIESIRILDNPLFNWGLGKSAEQLARLLWVAFLVCSYAPLNEIRMRLLVLCIYVAAYEVLKAIMFYTAKNSYLIGKNTNLIHNHVKRIMLQDDLHTTPINSCDYIVMGETNHEIDICSNGYHLGQKKANSEGVLTIGRVFQFNSSEAVTWVYPDWRDTCVSLALAKMLRRRFAKLPLDEAGYRKALDFVQEDLIDYIGSNRDIQTGRNLKENSIERVFSIIQVELMFVSDFLHIKVPTYNYFHWFAIVDSIGCAIVSYIIGSHLEFDINDWSSSWKSLGSQGALNQCFFNVFRKGSVVVEIFSFLDQAITELLVFACTYIQLARVLTVVGSKRWSNFNFAKKYIKDPAKWNRSYRLLAVSYLRKLLYCLANCMKKVSRKARRKNFKEPRFYSSVLDLKPETILFCIKVDVSILTRLPKWIRRIIPRSTPTVHHSTDTKEAILRSLRNNGTSQLTNGETTLKIYDMEHLKLVCHPNGTTTEAILVWNIATTLFHHQECSPHQNKRNNNPFNKAQVVALELSSYCHYLVKYLPELLPDEAEWTKGMYETVTKEVLIIPWSCNKKPRETYLCSYILHAMWVQNSVVGKGVMLAKDLMNCADRAQVWRMLADFWAEMMLFIAPSDNVEAHEKLLERGELITQLWALLTHAGIVTRPKPTEHQDHESENESNAVTGDMNV